jgi:hypothetical protein
MIKYLCLLIAVSSLYCTPVQAIKLERVFPDPDTSKMYFKDVLKEGEKIIPHLDGLVIDRVSIGQIQYGASSVETATLENYEYMAMAVGYPVLDMDMSVCDAKNKMVAWDTAQDKAAGVSFTANPGQHLFILVSSNMREPLGYYYFVLAHKQKGKPWSVLEKPVK